MHPLHTTCILTFTDRWFDLADPYARDVFIHDVANGLAQTNRYAGQIRYPYSVAQHSVLCARVAAPEDAFEALMHDAAEAYLTDMPKPGKNAIVGYREAEKRIDAAVRERFGLPRECSAAVKAVDVRMLATEAKHFDRPWWSDVGMPPYTSVVIEPWSWIRARDEFLAEFERLRPR